jgi:hypothetical protein
VCLRCPPKISAGLTISSVQPWRRARCAGYPLHYAAQHLATASG